MAVEELERVIDPTDAVHCQRSVKSIFDLDIAVLEKEGSGMFPNRAQWRMLLTQAQILVQGC